MATIDNPTTPDPIVFGDLRDREAEERKRLTERLSVLHSIAAKRAFRAQEEAEEKEIRRKLLTDDIVDPLYNAIRRTLNLEPGNHKDGLLPSQRVVKLQASCGLGPDGSVTNVRWHEVVKLNGRDLEVFDGDLALSNALAALAESQDVVAVRNLIAELRQKFNAYVATSPSQEPEDETPANSDFGQAIEAMNPGNANARDFLTKLGDAVTRQGLLGACESLVDWVFFVFSQTTGAQLTAEEKKMAAVYGLLAADKIEPPAFHPSKDSRAFNPNDKRRDQAFSKSLFSADGEYTQNRGLFTAVLPFLVDEGHLKVNRADVVSAIEWAQVVRNLIDRDVSSKEPQLGRRVREALDTVQNVGVALPFTAINIDLPDIEEQDDFQIQADNIRALQPAYFAAMFEELKAFQVVDKLVELFQNGVLPIGRVEAGNGLFRYWKEAATRVSESERRAFYARTLGITGGDDAGMPNREFNDLWLRFLSSVSQVVRQFQIDDLLRSKIPGAISQQQVRKSARDLAANLSLHGYGMAFFMATELQKQVTDVIKLLSDADIRSAYGAKDMWQVIDQVATLELPGGSRNSLTCRTKAASGAIIIAWLANHAREISSNSFGPLLDLNEITNPGPRANGAKATTQPTDFDLWNACEQWLAATGTQEDVVMNYSQYKESPSIPTKPIQIPSIARDMLESAGVPAMGMAYNNNGGYRRY